MENDAPSDFSEMAWSMQMRTASQGGSSRQLAEDLQTMMMRLEPTFLLEDAVHVARALDCVQPAVGRVV